MNNNEHNLQVACVRWFRYQYPNAIIYAVPNGGQRNAIVAAKLKAEGVLAGVPDLFVAVAAGGWHGLYIEMKDGKQGRLSPHQARMIIDLQRAGYKCVVCRSFDEFEAQCNDYLDGVFFYGKEKPKTK